MIYCPAEHRRYRTAAGHDIEGPSNNIHIFKARHVSHKHCQVCNIDSGQTPLVLLWSVVAASTPSQWRRPSSSSTSRARYVSLLAAAISADRRLDPTCPQLSRRHSHERGGKVPNPTQRSRRRELRGPAMLLRRGHQRMLEAHSSQATYLINPSTCTSDITTSTS